jgi:mRNA interferase MazF
MLSSGDVVELDLGPPTGREAGFGHPTVVVTAQLILDANPNIVHVVPLTTNIRVFGSEVRIEPDDDNGLDRPSAAQCQHVRAVSTNRIDRVRGNVGVAVVAQIRETIGLILDIGI